MRKPRRSVYTIDEFISNCNRIHNNKYDYSKVNFRINSDKVTIICPIHGEFEQIAKNHFNGCECYNCFSLKRGEKRAYSREEIVNRATSIWGDRFNYSDMEYTGILNKHEIKCNLCGEKFIQDLNNHINYKKNGCPNCKFGRGWSRSQWVDYCNRTNRSIALVYIVRCFSEEEEFVKIGITSSSTMRRFHRIPYEYEVIKEIKGSPLFVYDKEIELHRKFVKYRKRPLKSFKGEFECYSTEILDLL